MLILSRRSILVNLFIWCNNYYFHFESNQMTLSEVNPKIVQKSLNEFLIYVLRWLSKFDQIQNHIQFKRSWEPLFKSICEWFETNFWHYLWSLLSYKSLNQKLRLPPSMYYFSCLKYLIADKWGPKWSWPDKSFQLGSVSNSATLLIFVCFIPIITNIKHYE